MSSARTNAARRRSWAASDIVASALMATRSMVLSSGVVNTVATR